MNLLFRTLGVSLVLLSVVACSKGESTATDVTPNAPSGEAPAREWSLQTTVDAEGQLVTEVTPSPGFRINTDYPWRLTVDDASQGAPDADTFSEKKARFVTSTAAEKGSAVEGELRFSVCNDATCLTPRETVSWQL